MTDHLSRLKEYAIRYDEPGEYDFKPKEILRLIELLEMAEAELRDPIGSSDDAYVAIKRFREEGK